MEDKEGIVRKIKALLEMAGRDPDSNEGKLAAERAGELLAKYKIAFSSIETEEEATIGREFCPIYMQENALYEHHLITQIAQIFQCKAVKESYDNRFAILGKKSDVELTLWYFKYLRMVISKKADRNTSKKGERKSYGLGMVRSISSRIKELMTVQEQNLDATTKDLVVVQDAKVAQEYHKLYPSVRKGKAVGNVDGDAYRRGIDDGHKISLSKPINGSSTTPSALN